MSDGPSKPDGAKEERASLLEEGHVSIGKTALNSDVTATAPEAKRPKKTPTEQAEPTGRKPRKGAE